MWTPQNKSQLQQLITKRGRGNKDDWSPGLNSECFNDTVGGDLSHTLRTQKWLAFPWNPNSLQRWRLRYFSSISKLLFLVPGFALHNLTDWKYLTENQEAVLIGWLWAIMFLGLEVSCWPGLPVRSVLPLGYTELETYKPRLSIVLNNPMFSVTSPRGPSAKPLPCLTEFDLQGWRFVIGARDSVLVG